MTGVGFMNEPHIPEVVSPRCPRQWFHISCLPLLWLAVAFSFLSLVRTKSGVIASYFGAGIPVLAFIGLFQDLLRVRRWVCLLCLSPAMAVVVFRVENSTTPATVEPSPFPPSPRCRLANSHRSAATPITAR